MPYPPSPSSRAVREAQQASGFGSARRSLAWVMLLGSGSTDVGRERALTSNPDGPALRPLLRPRDDTILPDAIACNLAFSTRLHKSRGLRRLPTNRLAFLASVVPLSAG